jgi:hypothetical protein
MHHYVSVSVRLTSRNGRVDWHQQVSECICGKRYYCSIYYSTSGVDRAVGDVTHQDIRDRGVGVCERESENPQRDIILSLGDLDDGYHEYLRGPDVFGCIRRLI